VGAALKKHVAPLRGLGLNAVLNQFQDVSAQRQKVGMELRLVQSALESSVDDSLQIMQVV